MGPGGARRRSPGCGSAHARAEEVRSTRRAAKVPVFEALVPKRRDVVRVAVAGASGYMGAELLRLLLGHPRITVTGVTSERLAGELLGRAYPHLRGLTELAFHDLDAEWLARIADAVFLALPHLQSQRVVPVLRRRGVRAIDLSADYRLRDPNDYVTWYKAPHTDLAGLAEAVYGLPELHRKAIAGAPLVASPGCYAAGAILATAPLLKRGLARLDGIVIDGKSGVTGAGAQGRKIEPMYLYTEANENVQAYGIASHRHTPEIEQELGALGRAVCLSAIDNLGKGGSANGVQNLNVMFGWPERTGLEAPPVYP